MIDQNLDNKYQVLLSHLRQFDRIAVAFSGGVDSAFLLYAAKEALGDNVLAITAVSPIFPSSDEDETREFCSRYDIQQEFFSSGDLEKPHFQTNPKDRCYHCKKDLFTGIQALAAAHGIHAVAEGSNMDDRNDYRPGRIAIEELGILSPLLETGFYKSEIRELSNEFGLPTWDKPSFACLASRFVYGEAITNDKLRMVEQAEKCLHDLGFRQCRVRIHGMMARIELLPEDMERFFEKHTRDSVNRLLKILGFKHVSVDLQGYRTGSMNE